MTIKNWDYWKVNNLSPYSDWFSMDMHKFKFVPLSAPCDLHADPDFDAYVSGCDCNEFKFVKRSDAEIEEIRALQESVRRESILAQADRIRQEELSKANVSP